MERSGMLRILHNHIADPRKLHSQSPVVAYEETPEGITVTTADGQTFPGSILIGADGIHSRVRQLMADKILLRYRVEYSAAHDLIAQVSCPTWSSTSWRTCLRLTVFELHVTFSLLM
ncbi:hypothetical protein RIB2604_03101520 [Aspergillus luchuensis]|uniref:FAD-binding domain-containing protein n=1 Tax=Aspergillus kawachii TaxID=1069201 RepID=A0A146FWT6_ASPKA|nr:hypothetical protein RIB2604_03101520 [Aspergillus luchuensis]